MATKRDTTTPQPAEAPALAAFRDAFATIHKDALTRTAADDEYRAALHHCEALYATYLGVAGTQWGYREMPEFISAIAQLVQRYRRIATATLPLKLAGDVNVDAPAMESGAVRARLKAAGDEILAECERALCAGVDRLVSRAERAMWTAEAVDYWLGQATTGALLIAFYEIERDPAPNQLPEVFDCYASRAVIHRNERDQGAPAALLLSDRAEWLPYLRQRAAEIQGNRSSKREAA